MNHACGGLRGQVLPGAGCFLVGPPQRSMWTKRNKGGKIVHLLGALAAGAVDNGHRTSGGDCGHVLGH